MKRVNLGKSGLSIHPLVFGTLPLGPLQAGLEVREGARLIRTALDAGVNLLDTAAMYQTYPYIRSALEGYSGEVLIASKTHAADAKTAREHIETALRELNRETLDIVHLHGARFPDPFVERAAVFDELLLMRSEGKIAHLGLSTHYIGAVKKAAAHDDIEVIHPLINRPGLGILDGTAGQMATAIEDAALAGKGIYAMKALAGGNLISDARQSIDYVRTLPGVDAVALGMLSDAEIYANVALFENAPADLAVWESLQQRRRRLKIMDNFCKGCGVCVDACASGALSVGAGHVLLDADRCILCGYCAPACPDFLIRVV
jgi:predicted aldo/keto reductase-like oxidoreductase